MKMTKCRVFLLFFVCTLASCGGGSSGSSAPTYNDVNTINGTTGVDVDLAFRYTFSGVVTASTVTTSTYFIVPTPMMTTTACGTVPPEHLCT